MRVLLIVTGGTITMLPARKVGTSYQGLSCAPLEEYLRSQPELRDSALPEFTIYEWEKLIDSSDMNEQHWRRLASDIEENYEKFDGFVILHGTDSLAYTASALSFMLENLGKPVVLTGSMLPMSHIHSDARRNVTCSLMVAGFSAVPEVMVVFGSRILRGCRTVKVDCTSTEAFDSPNCHPLGFVGIDITVNKPYVLPPPTGPLKIFKEMRPSSVFALAVTPGLNPFIIRHLAASQERPLGLILELFGTGTAPMNNPAFIDAIQFALVSGVTIVAVTQCGRGTCSLLTYANGVKMHELGVIEGRDLTLESAFTKLAYLFGKGYEGPQLRRFMEMDLRGEVKSHATKITGQGSLDGLDNLPVKDGPATPDADDATTDVPSSLRRSRSSLDVEDYWTQMSECEIAAWDSVSPSGLIFFEQCPVQ